jgi:transcriptional regulator with PAS, ATPase and Fis domain
LIRGQSGTGKELVAAHIHYNSSRKYEKFVAVNCGSLPAELIESELFGFEQGAFTGAKHEKPGLFEVANNGTLFLDEIGELPLGAQVKLLRALQEGEIDKIGRIDKVKVNVRIIAATNKNLEEEVRQKRFREDLYYRLNVITIQLLPLQHRSEDIVQLVEYFLHKFCHEMGRSIPEISPQAWDLLKQYSWPGNVRELQNVVQRLLFINTSPLTAAHVKNALGLGTQLTHPENAFSLPSEVIPLKEIEREFRKTYFEYVRKQTKSDADAAKLLGLAPPNFYRMCKELGIK